MLCWRSISAMAPMRVRRRPSKPLQAWRQEQLVVGQMKTVYWSLVGHSSTTIHARGRIIQSTRNGLGRCTQTSLSTVRKISSQPPRNHMDEAVSQRFTHIHHQHHPRRECRSGALFPSGLHHHRDHSNPLNHTIIPILTSRVFNRTSRCSSISNTLQHSINTKGVSRLLRSPSNSTQTLIPIFCPQYIHTCICQTNHTLIMASQSSTLTRHRNRGAPGPMLMRLLRPPRHGPGSDRAPERQHMAPQHTRHPQHHKRNGQRPKNNKTRNEGSAKAPINTFLPPGATSAPNSGLGGGGNAESEGRQVGAPADSKGGAGASNGGAGEGKGKRVKKLKKYSPKERVAFQKQRKRQARALAAR